MELLALRAVPANTHQTDNIIGTDVASHLSHINLRKWSCHGWNCTRLGDHQAGNRHVNWQCSSCNSSAV